MFALDLLKVKFQVATESPKGGIGTQIWHSLREIHAERGWRGLYRGVGPNIAGNASSWGLYFLLCVISPTAGHQTEHDTSYNQLKRRASGGDLDKPLSAGQYLLCSAQASSRLAFL